MITPKDYAASQKNLNRLEKWTDRNIIEFSRSKS